MKSRKWLKCGLAALVIGMLWVPVGVQAKAEQPEQAAEKSAEKLVMSNPVASIGNEKYGSLGEALKKVKNGQTIKILRNMNTKTTYEINRPNVRFQLDLNKKYIGYVGVPKDKSLFWIRNGDVTIRNGKIYAKALETMATVSKSGRFTIYDGSYRGTIDNYGTTFIKGGAYYCYKDESCVEAEKGTVTIQGGTFRGRENAVSVDGGKVLIKGGVFEGERGRLTGEAAIEVDDKGIVNIYKGTVYTTNVSAVSAEGRLNIYGGTFKKKGACGLLLNLEEADVYIKNGAFSTLGNNSAAIRSDDTRLRIDGGRFVSSGSFKPLVQEVSIMGCSTTINGGQFELKNPKGADPVIISGSKMVINESNLGKGLIISGGRIADQYTFV